MFNSYFFPSVLGLAFVVVACSSSEDSSSAATSSAIETAPRACSFPIDDELELLGQCRQCCASSSPIAASIADVAAECIGACHGDQRCEEGCMHAEHDACGPHGSQCNDFWYCVNTCTGR